MGMAGQVCLQAGSFQCPAVGPGGDVDVAPSRIRVGAEFVRSAMSPRRRLLATGSVRAGSRSTVIPSRVHGGAKTRRGEVMTKPSIEAPAPGDPSQRRLEEGGVDDGAKSARIGCGADHDQPSLRGRKVGRSSRQSESPVPGSPPPPSTEASAVYRMIQGVIPFH